MFLSPRAAPSPASPLIPILPTLQHPTSASYAARVSDASVPIEEGTPAEVALLLDIADFVNKGQVVRDPSIDWITRANAMLPSAFSALFSGETDPKTQRTVKVCV